jgi:hypothetical protein
MAGHLEKRAFQNNKERRFATAVLQMGGFKPPLLVIYRLRMAPAAFQ